MKKEQIVKEIKKLIKENIRPALASHGGDIEFVEYKKGIVYVRLGGVCVGCAMAKQTLKSGVEDVLKHYIPEVKEVRAAGCDKK